MPLLSLPTIDQLANWSAFQADGATPSAAITLAQDNTTATPSGDSRSLRIVFNAGSATHRARFTLAAQDLGAFDELRLALRTDRASANPFTLELRLGSAALAIGAPGNAWHRRLLLAGNLSWELLRFSLDDLPAAVRGALSVIELQCLDDGQPFRVQIDQALAVRPRMLADLEAALLARLTLQFELSGNLVPAQTVPAGAALPAARPLIAILPLALRQATERTSGAAQRCDHVDGGYRLRPAALPYELGYAIEALADTRTDQAAITDWLLARLPLQGTLQVGAQPWSIEQQPPLPMAHELVPVPVPRQWLHYRVWAWQEAGAALPVRPTETLNSLIDWKESGHA